MSDAKLKKKPTAPKIEIDHHVSSSGDDDKPAPKLSKEKRLSRSRQELQALPGKKHIMAIEFLTAECKTIPQLKQYDVRVKHQNEVKGGFFRKATEQLQETNVRLHAQSTYYLAVHHITASNSIYTLNSVRIAGEFAAPLNKDQVAELRARLPFNATMRRYGQPPALRKKTASKSTITDEPEPAANDDDGDAGTITAAGEVVDRAKENAVLFFKWKPPANLLATDGGERRLVTVEFFFVAYKSRIDNSKAFADGGERAKVEQLASQARKGMDGDDQDLMDQMMLAPPEEERSRASGSRRSFHAQVEDELDTWADQVGLKSKLEAKVHFMSDMRVLKGETLHFIDFAWDAATLTEVQAPIYECDKSKPAAE